MGLDLTGFGTVASILGGVFDKISHFIPDPVEKAKAQQKFAEMAQAGEFKELETIVALAAQQTTTNTAEAASTNWFIAGWRPALGWTGALSYFYTFIVNPFLVFGATVWGNDSTRAAITQLPHLDMGPIATLTVGMLGLAGARSFEKWKGVEAAR